MQSKWFSPILVVLLFPLGILMSQNEQLAPRPMEGQRLFVRSGCVKCHSVFGFGGKVGSDLGRSLSHKATLEIVASMWNHSTEMSEALVKGQSIPHLDPGEMAALLSFFYYLNYFGEPGSPEKGAVIFREKGCGRCHQPGSPGPGPDLRQSSARISALALAQQMWNHGRRMIPRMKERGVVVPVFRGNEMSDLMAYLRSQSVQRLPMTALTLPGNMERGRRLVKEKKCLACHRAGGAGPELKKIDLNRSAAGIAARMWNHAAIMQQLSPLPAFSGNDLTDLLAYLFFLDFRVEAGDALKGEEIFRKKQCSKCHKLRLEERAIGPNLATARNLDDMIKISSAMWNHNLKMQQAMKKEQIPFPRFNGEELKNLLTFIQSIRNQELAEE